MTKQVLKIFIAHLSRYKWLTFITILAVITVDVIETITAWFYKVFFDILSEAGAIPTEGLAHDLLMTLFIILGLKLVSWIFLRIHGFITPYLQARVMADLQQSSFSYLIKNSYRFFTNNFSGSLVRKVNRLARAFEDITDQVLFNIIPLAVVTSIVFGVLFFRHPALAGALLVWTIIFIIVNWLLARWKQKYDFKKAAMDSEATGVLADAIVNSTNVKLFSAETHETSLYKRATEKLRKLRTFAWNISEIIGAAQNFLMIAIEFVLFYIAIHLWQKGVLTIGDFVLIQVYLLSLFGRLRRFGRVIQRLYEGIADGAEMVEILNTPHEVQDAKQAKKLRVTRGEIEFHDVSFSFQKTRKILKNFSMKIKPGEKVALVGPSGAGKTTITALILRLFDLDHGRITIDGTDIASVTQDSLRSMVALVPQEPILFHRTLIENIRYGKRNASEKEVIAAAKRAHCHEFITTLPEGYKTYVGERGIKLSGGERQRIAIARAILKDAPILILDEATSSLDSESEALIQDALKKLMKGKTVIVIAHRLSTIMQMDRTIVIDKGTIIDEGTHQTLLNHDGVYKHLWSIQAGGFIP